MVEPRSSAQTSLTTRDEQGSVKLIIVIVQDYDTDRVLRPLTEHGFGATRIASTGSFLRTGNVTILVGAEDDRVDKCLALIRDACAPRTVSLKLAHPPDLTDIGASSVADVTMGGGVIFVLPVARFERIDVPIASGRDLAQG